MLEQFRKMSIFFYLIWPSLDLTMTFTLAKYKMNVTIEFYVSNAHEHMSHGTHTTFANGGFI